MSQPFDGITVVEFGQFVAVPFAAQLLAEGGANVIKIEALAGDPTRQLRPIAPGETRTFISRNRGKRSLPLQLSDPDARPVIHALLENADVVLMNFRPGLAEKLGLGNDELRRRYPRLIIGAVSAFGTKGPDAEFAGMDIVVQARTGLMAANGRMIDGRPAPGDPVSADYMCAMTVAFGVSAALFRRATTGEGAVIETSLMQAAMTIENNQLVRADAIDKEKHERVIDRLAKQRSTGADFATQAQSMSAGRAMPLLKVYFRTFETADAPIAIACGSRGLRVRFLTVLGIEDAELDSPDNEIKHDHYDELMAKVEAMMLEVPSSTWVARFQAAGVPVSTVKFPVELFDDEHVDANGMLHRFEHPLAGPMTVPSPPIRLSDDGFRARGATPPLGSTTRTILSEIGFDDKTVDGLIAAGITRAEND